VLASSFPVRLLRFFPNVILDVHEDDSQKTPEDKTKRELAVQANKPTKATPLVLVFVLPSNSESAKGFQRKEEEEQQEDIHHLHSTTSK
jgi:hypothetical protein